MAIFYKKTTLTSFILLAKKCTLKQLNPHATDYFSLRRYVQAAVASGHVKARLTIY